MIPFYLAGLTHAEIAEELKAVLADGTALDARPSDALTLASLTGSPIYVAADVLLEAAERLVVRS